MKKIILAAAFAFAAFTVPALAQSEIQNFIEVRAKGEIEAEPNEFKVSILIDEAATKGKYSIREVESKMISALKSVGVDTKAALKMDDMTTISRKKDNLTKSQYTLTLSSKQEVSESFGVLDDLGITSLDLRSVSHSDIEGLQAQARIKAVNNAKQRAGDICAAMGQTLGECFQVQDYSNNYYGNYVYETRMLKAGAMADESSMQKSEPSIEFKKIKVSADISMRFILPLKYTAQIVK